MKSSKLMLAALALGALVATGCSTSVRYLTHTLAGDDHVYIAYAETEETNFFLWSKYLTTSRVLRCNFDDNNVGTCVEEEDLFRHLNPHISHD